MINIDEKWHDCCAIDTEAFLEATLGEMIDLSEIDEEHGTNLEELTHDKWLMQIDAILKGTIEGQEYSITQVHNTYNEENDLSADIQFCIFYPANEGDWLWSNDCYVAIEPHLGGDPRGNYGATRLYKVDCLGETGFFDTMLGWHAEPLEDFSEYNQTSVDFKFPHGLAYNDKLDSIMELESDFDTIETLNERCSTGYSSNPTCELREHLSDDAPEYSEELKCYIASLPGGALVKLHPECNLPR